MGRKSTKVDLTFRPRCEANFAVAVSGPQVAYGSTVITGVQPGNALETVPLVAQAGASTTAASITGQITTSTGSAGTAANISLSVLQPISVNGTTVFVTIPLAAQSAATASLATASAATCPAKTDCVSYALSVAAANPSVGHSVRPEPSSLPHRPVDLWAIRWTQLRSCRAGAMRLTATRLRCRQLRPPATRT